MQRNMLILGSSVRNLHLAQRVLASKTPFGLEQILKFYNVKFIFFMWIQIGASKSEFRTLTVDHTWETVNPEQTAPGRSSVWSWYTLFADKSQGVIVAEWVKVKTVYTCSVVGTLFDPYQTELLTHSALVTTWVVICKTAPCVWPKKKHFALSQ